MAEKKFLATRQPDNGWYLHRVGTTQGKHGASIDECLRELAYEGDRVQVEIGYYKPEYKPPSDDDIHQNLKRKPPNLFVGRNFENPERVDLLH